MRPAGICCISQGVCKPSLITRSSLSSRTPAQDKSRQTTRQLQYQHVHATPSNGQQSTEDEEIEGLSQEEDWTVPGGYQDSLSSNTELGRAVQDACEELDNLSNLEKESLSEASKLLQKLGYKGNIFQRSSPAASDDQSGQE